MPRPVIRSEDLEQAEAALSRTYQLVAGTAAHERVLTRAGVDPETWEKFARHHKDLLFKKYMPDIDPRHEPAIMTMLLHMFAVGAIAQRFSDGRPS